MANSTEIARLLCIGFEGTAVSGPLRDLVARGVRNVILFARNFQNAVQLKLLCRDIKALAPPGERILVCVDHEGGRVQRFVEGFTRVPAMREIGELAASGNGELEVAEHRARSLAHSVAGELRACGIDLNLGPVLDVDSNPDNPVIGDRSFGRDPHLVARLGCAMIESSQAGGVAACGKHFPGHGDTSTDSHFELPRLAHDLQRLREVELVPFIAAVQAGVACIMSAHVMFDALDCEAPATMSARVIDGLLRDDLGFDGVVITDDLEMKSIADHFGVEDGAVRACMAGVDMLMCCHTPQRQSAIIDALVGALQDGTLSRLRVDQALRRLNALHARFVR